MNVKLDEDLPVSLAGRLAEQGVDADTVLDEGLGGRTDEQVLSAARAAGRMLFTLDRGFGDIRRYPPGSHPGIVVFRLDDQSAAAVVAAVESLVRDHELDGLAGTVTVVQRGLLGIGRAEG